jgi:hypothetical protein
MAQPDHETRRGRERLGEPTERSEPLAFDPLAAPRTRRRIRNAMLVVVPVVVISGLIGGPLSFGSDVGTTPNADRDRDGPSPPSAGPTVSVERTDVVGTGSPTTELPDIGQADAGTAESVVSAFLDDLRRGDPEAAAERWTGYPELGPDAPPADKTPFVAALRADPAIIRILEDHAETFVTASWGSTAATPVVTALAPRDGDDPAVAVAFLTGFSEEHGDPEVMWIHRLPQTDDAAAPSVAGSVAEPGRRVEIPGVPLEGGARAYVDSREIPIDVDLASLIMRITLPEDVEGDVAVTVSTATGELPGAQAFALTIGSP